MKDFFSCLLLLGLILIPFSPLQSQDTLKVMHYNILRYGDCNGVSLANKDIWLNNITGAYQPDIFTVNEMGKFVAFGNRIKQFALTYGNMEYTEFTNTTNSDIVNMLFYNKDKLGYKGIKKIGNSLRDINVYTLYSLTSAQAGDTIFIDCIVAHLKAGSSTADQSQRTAATQSVVAWIAAQGPAYQNYIMMGDFNIYTANETAWFNLVRDPANSYLKDPTGRQNGWGANTMDILSQSPTMSRSDCGSGGGLDDRFDMILTSDALLQGMGRVAYVPGSYHVLGNDGNTSFNQSLNCVGNTSVPDAICADLLRMSDHLPVVIEIAIDNSTGFSSFPQGIPGIRLDQVKIDKESLHVSISGNAMERMSMELISIHGQTIPLVSDVTIGSWSMPVRELASGFYLFRVRNDKGQMITQKLIKQ